MALVAADKGHVRDDLTNRGVILTRLRVSKPCHYIGQRYLDDLSEDLSQSAAGLDGKLEAGLEGAIEAGSRYRACCRRGWA